MTTYTSLPLTLLRVGNHEWALASAEILINNTQDFPIIILIKRMSYYPLHLLSAKQILHQLSIASFSTIPHLKSTIKHVIGQRNDQFIKVSDLVYSIFVPNYNRFQSQADIALSCHRFSVVNAHKNIL